MAAYFMFIREEPIRDQSAMDEYLGALAGSPNEYDMTVLSLYGPMEVIEGDPADGVVLLKFPTIEEARAWYESDRYQAAKPHRQRAAKYRAILLEGK